MALTAFQRSICRLIANQRIASGESYVAGGAALNELLGGSRLSQDVDLFHDTEAALDASWRADRDLLESQGIQVVLVRERPSFVEAKVSGQGNTVLLQWVRDSAYRFFPLIEDPTFGLALHPFDLATNKVLALVGRLEVRDWVDVIQCSEHLQPLGYLAWAACGKDPGFSPAAILEQAGRSSHYSSEEVASLSFEGPAPDAGSLSRRWRALLADANQLVKRLPIEAAGQCVLDHQGNLLQSPPEDLPALVEKGQVTFHAGTIRGALPRIV
jgi:hypothetical protein